MSLNQNLDAMTKKKKIKHEKRREIFATNFAQLFPYNVSMETMH